MLTLLYIAYLSQGLDISYKSTGDVIVNVLASMMVDREFHPRSNQTKYYVTSPLTS
jgi:hypothetical protein